MCVGTIAEFGAAMDLSEDGSVISQAEGKARAYEVQAYMNAQAYIMYWPKKSVS